MTTRSTATPPRRTARSRCGAADERRSRGRRRRDVHRCRIGRRRGNHPRRQSGDDAERSTRRRSPRCRGRARTRRGSAAATSTASCTARPWPPMCSSNGGAPAPRSAVTQGFGDILRSAARPRRLGPLRPFVPAARSGDRARVDLRGARASLRDRRGPHRPRAGGDRSGRHCIAAQQPEAVAISFLHSYANPAHEQAFAFACRRAMPDVFVVTSSDVWPRCGSTNARRRRSRARTSAP